MNSKFKFGRLVSIVLCVCMVFTMIPTSVFAEDNAVTLPYANQKVVYDFEETQPKINSSWKTGEVMYWKQGDGSASGSYVTDESGNTSLGISFTSEMGNIRLPVSQVEESQTAISVDIDTSLMTASDLKFRFTFYAKAVNGSQTYGNEMVIGEGMPVYLISENNEISIKYATTGTETAGRWTYIPAGFKGTVLIPFTSFDSSIGTADYVSDIYCSDSGYSNILKIQPSKVDSGMNIYYDNIALWGDIVVPPYMNQLVVENFTDYTNQIKSDWSGMFGTWGNMSFDNFSETDGVFTASYPAGDDLIAAFRIPFMNDTQKAVGFNVDASSVTESFGIRTYFALYSAGGYIDTAPNTEVYILPDEGDIYIETVAENSCFYLPAGFKGKVIIPFEAFAQGTTDWDTVLASDEAKVQFQIRVSGLKTAAEISYDDISYYNSSVIEMNGITFNSWEDILYVEDVFSEPVNSIEAWIKLPSGNSTDSVFFSSYGTYGSPSTISAYVNATGNPVLAWRNATTSYIWTVSSVDMRNDNWTHIAFTRTLEEDGTSRLDCYINGALSESVNAGELSDIVAKTNYRIGCDWSYENNWNYTGSSCFDGEISKVRAWSISRTAEQIAAVLFDDAAADEEGLLGQWSFTDSAAESYADTSVNANNVIRGEYWIEADAEDFNFNSEEYYTFVAVPDTQCLVDSGHGWTDINDSSAITRWIADNQENMNIQFVMSLGDMVETGSAAEEWAKIAENYGNLEEAGIRYSPLLGNHDWDSLGKRDATSFNATFLYEEFMTKDYFGGAMTEGSMNNVYYTFEVDSTKYLILALECYPRNSVIEWANAVCKLHPDYNVILVEHSYLKNDGTYMTSESGASTSTYGVSGNDGDLIYEKLVKNNSNIKMVLCGHISSDKLVINNVTREDGSSVYEILADAQHMDYYYDRVYDGTGGTGMITLYVFSKTTDEVQVMYYSTVRNKFFLAGNQTTITLNTENTAEPYVKSEVIDVTDAGYSHKNLVNDFEYGPYSTSFGWDWTDPNHYYGSIESIGSNYGKLEIITNGNSATVGLNTNILDRDTTAIYLEFDATSVPAAIEFKPQYFTRSDNPEYGDIYYGENMPYLTVSRDGEITNCVSDTNGYVTVEAGFNGAVILPISSFSSFVGPTDETVTTTRDDVLYNYELNTSYDAGTSGYNHYNRRILRLTFRNASAIDGEAIKIDNLSYLSDNTDILYGDTNSDGEVDALDLTVLRKYILKTETDINTVLADANKDGFVNLKDLVKIKKIIAGINA